MATLLEHTEPYVDVAYRLVENIDDAAVLGCDTRLETWDGPSGFDPDERPTASSLIQFRPAKPPVPPGQAELNQR